MEGAQGADSARRTADPLLPSRAPRRGSLAMSTALVLIDLQNDYFPGSTMQRGDAEAAVQQAAQLLKTFRERELPIFHVQHVSKRAGATFFLPGTKGAEIHAAVQPRAGESVTTKHFPNSFRETGLLEALRGASASK